MHQRQTVVIGADGNVRKVYRKVDVGVHAQQILDDVAHVTPVTPVTHAAHAS
jgi:peroxiredoxin